MIFTVYFFAFLIVMLFCMGFTPKDSLLGMYSRNVMIGCTQFLNILTGGHPDQSFSGRSAVNRATKGGIWVLIANFIDAIFKLLADQDDHCRKAIEHDRPHTVKYPRKLIGYVSLAGALFAAFVLGTLLSHTI